MPTFIALNRGMSHNEFVNLDHVVRITATYQQGGMAEVIYYDASGGELAHDVTARPPDFAGLMAVVAAAPGERAVVIFVDTWGRAPTEADVLVEEYSVVAWRVAPAGAVPVLPEGILCDDQRVLVGLPGGRLWDAETETEYSGLDAAKAALLRDAQAAWRRRHGEAGTKETAPADDYEIPFDGGRAG